MRHPLTVPQPGTLHRVWPGFVAGTSCAFSRACTPGGWPALRDRLCATGVIALVLLTMAMCGILAVAELGPQRAAAAPAGNQILTSAALSGNAHVAAVSGQGWRQSPSEPNHPREIDVRALTILSTVINLLIFVALGLYLKWDAGRKR